MKKNSQAVLPELTDQPGKRLYTVCFPIREHILMTGRRKE